MNNQHNAQDKFTKGKEWISITSKKLNYSGYLMKLGKNQCWQRRLFKLEGNVIYCYKTQRIINNNLNHLYSNSPSATALNPSPHKYNIIKWKVNMKDIIDIQMISNSNKSEVWNNKYNKIFILILKDNQHIVLRTANKMDLDRWLFTLLNNWNKPTKRDSVPIDVRQACLEAWNTGLIEDKDSNADIKLNENEMICNLSPAIQVPFKQVEFVCDTETPKEKEVRNKGNSLKRSERTILSSSASKPIGIPVRPRAKTNQVQPITDFKIQSRHRRNQSEAMLGLPTKMKPKNTIPFIDIISDKQNNKEKIHFIPTQHNTLKKFNKPLLNDFMAHNRSHSYDSINHQFNNRTRLYSNSQLALNNSNVNLNLKCPTSQYLPMVQPKVPVYSHSSGLYKR